MEPPKPATGGGAVGNDLRMQRLAKQKRRSGMTARKGVAGPKRDEDLRRNPGIGQSKGLFATGAEFEELEGENTVEGDVENDPDTLGQVDERHGRANR